MDGLDLLFHERLSFRFEFFAKNLVVMLHDALHSKGGSDHVSEARHPHIPLVHILSTQHVNPLGGLHIEGESPVLGQISLVNLSFREVAISHVPKRNNLLSFF